jgi:hypothetical protein
MPDLTFLPHAVVIAFKRRTSFIRLVMAVPVTALLARLHTPSGDRLPVDVAKIVASFVPRSLAFGSLPSCLRTSEVVSLDEMRERIYRYIVVGDTVGGSEAMLGRPGWHYENFEVLIDYGIKILIFIGLEDCVTLQSIFSPPVVDLAIARGYLLSFNIDMRLEGFHSTWVHDHGPSPATRAWHDEVMTWRGVWLNWAL